MSRKPPTPFKLMMLKIRKELGYTHKYVSKQTGLSEALLARFENGDTRVSLDTLNTFIDFYAYRGYDIEKAALKVYAKNKINFETDGVPEPQRELLALMTRRELPPELVQEFSDRIYALEKGDAKINQVEEVKPLPREEDYLAIRSRKTIVDFDFTKEMEMSLPRRLKELRNYTQVTQKFLADFANISASRIGELESDGEPVSRDTIERIADYFLLRGLDVRDEFIMLHEYQTRTIHIDERIRPQQFFLISFLSRIKLKDWEMNDIRDCVSD